MIGSVNTATIDIGDIHKLGDGNDVNSASVLLHELVEEYLVQIRRLAINVAHKYASSMERHINKTGNNIPFDRRLDSYNKLWIPIQEFNYPYNNKGFIIVVFDENNNIIKVRR